MMSSTLPQLWGFSVVNVLHLLGILLIALLLTRLLRGFTNSLVQPSSAPARAAQQREQQTRALAGVLYSAGSKIIWAMALLTALPEFGISVLPGVALAAAVVLGLGFGARGLIRDIVAGFCILFEDQFVVGETIQAGNMVGRVEQLTLRRTLLRDPRGALVTLANSELPAVSNLSRDWSQAFVDVTVASETPVDKVVQALEAATAELRGDPSWSQALLDGPRILGVQALDHLGSTFRLQVRTAPTRQDEVCRELRRRVQLQFQRRAITASPSQGPAPLAVAETPLT